MIRLAASGIALIFSMVFIMHGIAMVDCPDVSHVPGQSFRVDIHAAGRQELDLLPVAGLLVDCLHGARHLTLQQQIM